MHIEFFEHESEVCQTMPFLVLCLVLAILNSFYFHVKVWFFQDIGIQDDAIGNMQPLQEDLASVYLFVISLVAPTFTRTPKTISYNMLSSVCNLHNSQEDRGPLLTLDK